MSGWHGRIRRFAVDDYAATSALDQSAEVEVKVQVAARPAYWSKAPPAAGTPRR
ncbi:MAG: hypothetical protein JF888_03040 [Candidatus Dormibacteraeota bacterium]|uniref:Uncharacterized protein n=1 Tax=Candidatus Dormiibacter inghamiae TaxID=3127013 RepID=A0A934KF09_9BACT|nr:hypothetical protein [Candidatus Dormibacteraeota bacterium]MBJ7605608.1 hypothetical protein [Candidatus Dormibacteraeota bacterium]